MNLWLTMLVGGGLTYLTRLSFIFLFGIVDPPAAFKRALRFVPPAVLTAIIFQELLIRDGGAALTFSNHRMLAGILAVAVGLRTRRSLLVIAVGMAALWVLNLAFPG